MKVRDIMKKAMAAEHDMTMEEAGGLMVASQISSLIYVEEDKIKGIITEQDVLANMDSGKNLKDVMHQKVVTIDPDEKIQEAASRMKENHVSILPVVKKGELVGIVSAGDVLREINEEGDFLVG